MQINGFRIVLKAKSFDRTCRFWGEVLALPRLQSWDRETGRGALFQAGSGIVEIQGRPREIEGESYDEAYDYQGPQHKMVVALHVPSAENAYEELLGRNKNIPGGLRMATDGSTVFETHDPDGVKVLLREG